MISKIANKYSISTNFHIMCFYFFHFYDEFDGDGMMWDSSHFTQFSGIFQKKFEIKFLIFSKPKTFITIPKFRFSYF